MSSQCSDASLCLSSWWNRTSLLLPSTEEWPRRKGESLPLTSSNKHALLSSGRSLCLQEPYFSSFTSSSYWFECRTLSVFSRCVDDLLADSFSSSCRLSRYQQFKDFQRRILVATNLFGRGMDIERVNIVFNYDMPEDSDTYLHRVRSFQQININFYISCLCFCKQVIYLRFNAI